MSLFTLCLLRRPLRAIAQFRRAWLIRAVVGVGGQRNLYPRGRGLCSFDHGAFTAYHVSEQPTSPILALAIGGARVPLACTRRHVKHC